MAYVMDRAEGVSRLERMKLLREYNGIRQGVPDLSRVERMRALKRINEIRTVLGMGAEPTPEPTPENPLVKTLREILAGARDNLDLRSLLDSIGIAVEGLSATGELVGEIEDLADAAITHWANLEAAEA